MIPLSRREWLQAAAITPLAMSTSARAAPSADDLKAVLDKAVKFLAGRQKDNGDLSPTPRAGPGITALAVAALVRNGYGRQPRGRQGARRSSKKT